MRWRRTAQEIERLQEERKALAERYTIDTEEAQRREELAAQREAARRAAEEAARRAKEEAARRAAEKDAARQAAREAPETKAAAAAGVRDEDAEEEADVSAELPIYRWFGSR